MSRSNPEFTDSYVESIKQEYDQNGCIKFEGVLEREEALELGAELKELIEDNDNNAQWKGDFLNDEERGKTKILDMHDVHSHPNASEEFKGLRRDPRILSRLAVLLGGSVDTPVMNHHDKGFVKPGKKGDTHGGKFPKHQDYPFFPHADDRMLAAIVYMSDVTEEMGPVKVYPGSHADGPRQHKSVEGSEPYLEDDVVSAEDAVTMTGRAGDMVVFNVNMVHESGFNRSMMDRISWLIQVRHAENEPKLSEYYQIEPFEGEQLWPPQNEDKE